MKPIGKFSTTEKWLAFYRQLCLTSFLGPPFVDLLNCGLVLSNRFLRIVVEFTTGMLFKQFDPLLSSKACFNAFQDRYQCRKTLIVAYCKLGLSNRQFKEIIVMVFCSCT